MMWLAQTRPGTTIKLLIEKIIANGHMSRTEHIQLTTAVLSDQRITDEERRQINRVFDYIQIGRLKLVD